MEAILGEHYYTRSATFLKATRVINVRVRQRHDEHITVSGNYV